jgi:phosphoglycolate phosphatase
MITGGDDGSSEKRLKVEYTLQALQLKEGVMAGDTPLDVDAGKRNGLATVGVTYGWVSPERVKVAEPTRLVDRPEDLYQAVMDCLN